MLETSISLGLFCLNMHEARGRKVSEIALDSAPDLEMANVPRAHAKGHLDA